MSWEDSWLSDARRLSNLCFLSSWRAVFSSTLVCSGWYSCSVEPESVPEMKFRAEEKVSCCPPNPNPDKPPGEGGLEVPPSVDWLPLRELPLSSRGFFKAG